MDTMAVQVRKESGAASLLYDGRRAITRAEQVGAYDARRGRECDPSRVSPWLEDAYLAGYFDEDGVI